MPQLILAPMEGLLDFALHDVLTRLGGEHGQGGVSLYVQINTGHINPRAWAGRMKQWLSYLRRRHPEAERAYQQLRTVSDSPVMVEWLDTRLAPAGAHACDPACA